MVMRDIALSRFTGAPVHFQHLSTGGSIAMVRAARQAGVAVTAEAATHHFTLTDEACASYDPVFKVNPPLRPADDREAVREGLADGAVDAIATDHAPHTPDAKEMPFDQAPPGMLGLETALALALTELNLPIAEVVGLLSWRPRPSQDWVGYTVGRSSPVLRPICACSTPMKHGPWTPMTWPAAPEHPYAGRQVRGRFAHTVVGGQVVFVDQEVRA